MPRRTAHVAESAFDVDGGVPARGHAWRVLAAVVVAPDAADRIREDVRTVVAEATACAARQAGGLQPWFGLLDLLAAAPAFALAVHRRHPAGRAARGGATRDAGRAGRAAIRALARELVLDGVDRVVVGRHPPVDRPDLDTRRVAEVVADGTVPDHVELIRTDVVAEPLLRLSEVVSWTHRHDLEHPGRPPLTGRLRGRFRVVDPVEPFPPGP